MSSDTGAGVSPPDPSSQRETDRTAARYLFAISVLSGSGRVATGELREYMDVTPATVTETVSRLDDRGLVDYEKYQGVTLTDRGVAVARRAGWRFCVVATFFESTLDATVDDETAFDIGYVLPDGAVRRLRDLVGPACLGRCPELAGDAERCLG